MSNFLEILTLPNIFRIYLFISFLFWCFAINKFKQKSSKIIFYIVAIQAITETYVFITNYICISPYVYLDQFLYTIVYQIISVSLYLYYFIKITKDKLSQDIQKYILGLYYIIIALVFILNPEEVLEFQPILFLSSLIFICINIIIFMYHFFLNNKKVDFHVNFPLWVALALFVSYTGLLPIIVLGPVLSVESFNHIYYSFHIISYTILNVGLLWKIRNI